VEAFLNGRIAWWQISTIVEQTLRAGSGNADEVQDVLDADREARERATNIVDHLTGQKKGSKT